MDRTELVALTASPSAGSWADLVDGLRTARREGWVGDGVLDVLDESLGNWPDALRVAPDAWAKPLYGGWGPDAEALAELRIARRVDGLERRLPTDSEECAERLAASPHAAFLTDVALPIGSGALVLALLRSGRLPRLRRLRLVGKADSAALRSELATALAQARSLRSLSIAAHAFDAARAADAGLLLEELELEGVPNTPPSAFLPLLHGEPRLARLALTQGSLSEEAIEGLAKAPGAAALDALDVPGTFVNAREWGMLTGAVFAGRLRRLTVRAFEHGVDLSELPSLESLRSENFDSFPGLAIAGLPLRALDLHLRFDKEAFAFAAGPGPEHLRYLNLRGKFGPAAWKALLKREWHALEHLSLGVAVTPGGLKSLFSAKTFPRLHTLELPIRLGDPKAWIAALGACRHRLRVLDMRAARGGGDALLEALAKVEALRDLETLVLQSLTAGVPGYEALAGADMPKLRRLDVNHSELTDASVEALSRASFGRELRALSLDYSKIGDRGARAISRGFPKLQALSLYKGRVTSEGAIALTRHGRIERLVLGQNPINLQEGDPPRASLLRKGGHGQLEYLDLSSCILGDEEAEYLDHADMRGVYRTGWTP